MTHAGLCGCWDLREFGAVGDGATLATAALQAAIDACHDAGGGTVVVPAGTWLTGTIYLRSRVTLHLNAGATLLASPRREDYNPDDVFPENPVFSHENVTGAHLVIAYRAQQVAITGEGTIDGNGAAFFEPLPPGEAGDSYQATARNFAIREWRPGQMVFFCRCTDVAVRDVALMNAPYWTLLLLGCTRVQVRGVRISNPPQTPNGDGLDIDCCRQVAVSDCIIATGDDALTLRGHSRLLGEEAQECCDVVVSNCVLASQCNAIRVGVGDGVVRDCRLSNLIIRDTRTGICMVSAYSARAAHGVRIESIHFSDITMDVILPLNVVIGQHARAPAAIRHVSFSHLWASAQQGAYIGGNPGLRLQDIRLHEVQLRLSGADVDPEFAAKTPMPSGRLGVPAGLFVREVDGLRINGLQVAWDEVSGSWQHAAVIERCDDVVVAALDAEAPPTETAGQALSCREVTNLTVTPLGAD
ncbi:MAG: glycoside hydrolase family 28 protein [Armatimonadota bacterium]